jgi:hypothetical protein
MKSAFCLYLCLTITTVSFGQEKPAPVPVAAEIPPGPSIKETEAWFKRELRNMGSDYVVTKFKETTWGEKYEIESAVLSDCNLTIRQVRRVEDVSKPMITTSTITLKDVDVEKLRVVEIPVGPESTNSKPSYRIVVTALPDRGDAFMVESEGYAGGKTKRSVRAVVVRVREQSLGNQAVPFFRRAAILCGAPYQSAALSGDQLAKVLGRYNAKEKSTNYVELRADGRFIMKHDAENLSGNYKIEGDVITFVVSGLKDPLTGHLIGNTITNNQGVVGWEKSTASATPQGETSKPDSSVGSKMTNEQVIQLVAAGLSEQVIINSIRQAIAKDFDLTPTGLIALKKANVPEAVILVMQETGTREQASSTSDTKTPPKYDATLTKQPVSPPPDICPGIESLGIFQNTALDPAIGGGVVEWLAKIRNNTNVTKIVVFAWIDMYGQQKKAQVQIRGGDIASVRLDLTQARVIPPVRDLRVLSCQ